MNHPGRESQLTPSCNPYLSAYGCRPWDPCNNVADAARGLLRHDHGSALMSDHFQNQIAFLGMTPSFAFVRQPETNGVAERFIRTLKEQVVWGRIFRHAEEVRVAVRAFV